MFSKETDEQAYRRNAPNMGNKYAYGAAALRWMKVNQSAACWYCGDPSNGRIDHVVSVSQGGRLSVANLVPCCYECNRQKGDLSVSEFRCRRELRIASSQLPSLKWTIDQLAWLEHIGAIEVESLIFTGESL